MRKPRRATSPSTPTLSMSLSSCLSFCKLQPPFAIIHPFILRHTSLTLGLSNSPYIFPPSLPHLGLHIFTLSAPCSLLRSLISSRLFAGLLFHPRLFFQCAVSQWSDYRAVKVTPKFMSQFSADIGSELAARGICCVEMSVF